jgi:hypothetical protein
MEFLRQFWNQFFKRESLEKDVRFKSYDPRGNPYPKDDGARGSAGLTQADEKALWFEHETATSARQTEIFKLICSNKFGSNLSEFNMDDLIGESF